MTDVGHVSSKKGNVSQFTVNKTQVHIISVAEYTLYNSCSLKCQEQQVAEANEDILSRIILHQLGCCEDRSAGIVFYSDYDTFLKRPIIAK